MVKTELREEKPPWVAPSRTEFEEFGLRSDEKVALRYQLNERRFLPPKSKFWREICEGALARVRAALGAEDRNSWGKCVMHILNIEVIRHPRDAGTLVKLDGTGPAGWRQWQQLTSLTRSSQSGEIWALPPFPASWSGLLELQMDWARKEGILVR
jgi:hypothetical protein